MTLADGRTADRQGKPPRSNSSTSRCRFERLEARVAEIAEKLARIPLSQLQVQKLIVNQAYENMGLASTQTLGGILDGLMRNTPDALEFMDTAANQGVRAAIERRDGQWGDYSQAPPDRRPDPSHVIVP